jgi:HAMP domain-containing protein
MAANHWLIMRLSVKLGAICAAAALLPFIIASLIVLPQLSSYWHRQAIENLQSDSRAAAGLYEKRLVELRSAAREIANRALVSNDNSDTNSSQALARLQDMLARALDDYGLDFIIIADPQGRVIARHNGRPAQGETVLGAEDRNLVAEKVISGNQTVASAVVERGEQLERFGIDRRAQVRVADGSTVEDTLMIEAGVPVIIGGRLIGIALIGQMLNNFSKPRPGASSLQTPLIAEIRQTLYRNAGEDRGALIAYGPFIVASNFSSASGGESPLTGVSRDTGRSEETINQGARSYIVAWQPIKSPDSSEVGALGVARPATELDGQKAAAQATLILVAALAFALAGVGGFFYGRALAVRLDDLAQAASRWSVGELSAPAKDRDPMMSKWIPRFISSDEISHLAAQLEQMRESFRQAIERLRKR